MKAASLPLNPSVILPVWFNNPLAGGFVRLWQTMAKKLEFKLEIILGSNGRYMPSTNDFSKGFFKEVDQYLQLSTLRIYIPKLLPPDTEGKHRDGGNITGNNKQQVL